MIAKLKNLKLLIVPVLAGALFVMVQPNVQNVAALTCYDDIGRVFEYGAGDDCPDGQQPTTSGGALCVFEEAVLSGSNRGVYYTEDASGCPAINDGGPATAVTGSDGAFCDNGTGRLELYTTGECPSGAIDAGTPAALGGSTSSSGGSSTCTSHSNCELFNLINGILNVMALLTTLIVVAVAAVGGIQYSASNGNPQRVQSAKNRIYNAIWAYVAFLGLYAFLNYLIPGGVFA
ncbi:MAG: hypothetical protein AAF413_00145 [Patescibacteria group bacterium]